MEKKLHDIDKLHEVWSITRTPKMVSLGKIDFNDLINSIISTGPFYYYIIDFFDLSLSNVSASAYDIHQLKSGPLHVNDILETIHPEDIEFIVQAEALITKFFTEIIGNDKIMKYKMNYSFRSRGKDGKYMLLNHQALLISLDENGKCAKSLNIHTCIDHISNHNTYKISLIGLDGEPSYMNISLENEGKTKIEFSKREIDIIRLISNGNSNEMIAEKLSISPHTVKKHRSNMLEKSECSSTAQLVKNCIQQGIL